MKSTRILLLLLGLPGAAFAQAPLIAPRASVVFAAVTAPTDETILSGGILGDGSKDYRYTGFWVGGVGLGALGAYAGYGLCMDSESPHTTGDCVASGFAGLLIAGFIGGVTGGMIGGLFSKEGPAGQ